MSTIFTVSSFMSKGNRRAELLNMLSSVMASLRGDERSLIDEFIVINEHDAARREDYGELVRARFPGVKVIQKTADDAGQARTLNMILDRIQDYDFWIHWEESWRCTRAFLADALDVMRSTDVTQLQFNPDWLDSKRGLVPKTTAKGTRYVEVLPDLDAPWPRCWPLYSLRPSINRADFCRQVGRFTEEPRLWPVEFEKDYGTRWLRRGGTKAVLTPPAAELQPNHQHTYG